MSIVITGGAGFIGSCLVKTLNDVGITDIIIVDEINDSIKWENLLGKIFTEYMHKDDFLVSIGSRDITSIIHLGACSSTTENNFDYLWKNNVEYSKQLFEYATQNNISFIYASSAATYGNGNQGFDDCCQINALRPLNRYGFSKQLFDLWVQTQEKKPPQCVGLKFFNVYGPNEYHKMGMFSMIYQAFHQIEQKGKVSLFKSVLPGVVDGEQKRDFIYVKDICKVILWFINNQQQSGLFNVGTGKAQTYNELVSYVFYAMGISKQIEYIDMPQMLKNQYQSFTEAKMEKLRSIGYHEEMLSLQDGIEDYVKHYLQVGLHY